jgi:hypothetical protein
MAKRQDLRAVLDELMAIKYPLTFKAAWDRVKRDYGHSIREVESNAEHLQTFNCYAYAFGIVDHPRYQALVQEHSTRTEVAGAITNSAFVSKLLSNGELREIDQTNAKTGDIVLYFSPRGVEHAAQLESGVNVIRSKWGPSELYEHGLWEVGRSFGDVVRYFAAPVPEHIIDLLEAHLSAPSAD